jgi:hypothetical protein
MGAILDVICSFLIAGYVTLMGLRMNMNIAESSDSFKADVVVQESLVGLVQTIEYDFRKMGFRVDDPTTVILKADSGHISFRGDINDNGTIDTVDWYLGGNATSTSNPNDKLLYRRLRSDGSDLISGSLPGVTVFGLKYLNHESRPPIALGHIWIVETTVRVESPWKVRNRSIDQEKYDDWGYSAAFWRQTRLASRNLKRHG